MTWLSILTVVLAIARGLVEMLQNKQLLDAGSAQATLKGLQDAEAAIQRANAARELVRADIARDPGSIMRDDGFRRD